ncbi:hypothetical protein [Flavobacterium sp.]|uniref:hypothetical protein n=1 Tax=Flavobacterium sp. TaxID=239 RepID=UPI00260D4A89|nr:hypothetical protein [Flavobacterium sp.]
MSVNPRKIAIYSSLPAAKIIEFAQDHITCDPDFSIAMIVTNHQEPAEFDSPIFYVKINSDWDYTGELESTLLQSMHAYFVDMILVIDADFVLGKFTTTQFKGKLIRYSTKLPVGPIFNGLPGVQVFHPNGKYLPVFTENATTHDLMMHPISAVLRAYDTNRLSFSPRGAHFERQPLNVITPAFGNPGIPKFAE